MSFFTNIKRFHRNNVDTLRHSALAEISGAFGDLGTLLPLMITLAVNGSISLSTTLVFSGFFNLATGVVFGIPLPVQPMKAIAASAIASHASQRETVAAGSVVAVVVLLLSITGLLRWATRVIPVPVVKGIQFGAGLSLVISAGSSLLQPLPWVHDPFDNRVWALAAFVALVATQKLPRAPYALLVFIVGLVLAGVALAIKDNGDGGDGSPPAFGLWRPYFLLPRWSRDAVGMGVAQLPLTTLNSVVAASALAADLLPHLPAPSVGQLGVSVAAMNLVGCWFGAMPVCHGAGGLAAQYRFGARSGASVALLGLLKMAVGLAVGDAALLGLLRAFPLALLGILVVAAGLELARVGQSLNHGASDLWETSTEESQGGDSEGTGLGSKHHRAVLDEERARRWTVMLMTTAGILAFKNDAVGFLAGLLCHWAYVLADAVERKRNSSSRQRRGERAPLLNA